MTRFEKFVEKQELERKEFISLERRNLQTLMDLVVEDLEKIHTTLECLKQADAIISTDNVERWVAEVIHATKKSLEVLNLGGTNMDSRIRINNYLESLETERVLDFNPDK